MKNSWLKITPYLKLQSVLWLYVVAAIAVSLQAYLSPNRAAANENPFTHYNNYVIFKQSFFHLLAKQNLYQYWLSEHWDLYKYSPTFALLMAPLAILPDVLGLTVWNLLNALLVFWAVKMLPNLAERTKVMILLFSLVELITAMQNSQSNAMLAGLIVLAYTHFERGNLGRGILLILFSGFIKIYGIAGLLLCLFYPNKPKMALYGAGFAALLVLLPLPFIGFNNLLWQYQNWAVMLANDHASSVGMSVQGVLSSWFGLGGAKNWVSLLGVVALLLPYVQSKHYTVASYRLLSLCALLVWLVIFNYKAESPTYIIAVLGVGIWHFSNPKPTYKLGLSLFVLVFTSLIVTDLTPAFFRNQYVFAYSLKAIPCMVAWGVMVWELGRFGWRKTKT